MPKTKKGAKIYASMREHYGSEKGKQVFYASENAGTIRGVHKKKKKKVRKKKKKKVRKKSWSDNL